MQSGRGRVKPETIYSTCASFLSREARSEDKRLVMSVYARRTHGNARRYVKGIVTAFCVIFYSDNSWTLTTPKKLFKHTIKVQSILCWESGELTSKHEKLS
jgi:hypothetical protein